MLAQWHHRCTNEVIMMVTMAVIHGSNHTGSFSLGWYSYWHCWVFNLSLTETNAKLPIWHHSSRRPVVHLAAGSLPPWKGQWLILTGTNMQYGLASPVQWASMDTTFGGTLVTSWRIKDKAEVEFLPILRAYRTFELLTWILITSPQTNEQMTCDSGHMATGCSGFISYCTAQELLAW